jgi:hypothetical protein
VPLRKPRLTVARILTWSDSHRARTSRWPSCTDGQVHGAPGETGVNGNQVLTKGLRGLPGGGGDQVGRRLRGQPGLDRDSHAAAVVPLLRPYPADAMRAYPVGQLVNNARNDGPGCLTAAV